MLQQTRVDTVIPYYKRFLERYENVNSLAESDIEEVLCYWSGLGYYRRAQFLHRAARQLVDEFRGVFPEDAGKLRALPGVGSYTAGAIASIAFDRSEPAVDGNVTRVLSRIAGIRDDVRSSSVRIRIEAMARELAVGPSPGEFNQSLMELGAIVCAPRTPQCHICPVQQHCEAFATGDQESLPRKSKRPKPRPVRSVMALVLRRGKALAVRRPPRGLFGGLWELPGGEIFAVEDCSSGLRRCLRESLGLRIENLFHLGSFRHVLTHRRLQISVYRADAVPGRVRRRDFDAHRWIVPSTFSELPHGVVIDKALQLVRQPVLSRANNPDI